MCTQFLNLANERSPWLVGGYKNVTARQYCGYSTVRSCLSHYGTFFNCILLDFYAKACEKIILRVVGVEIQASC